MIEYTEFVNRLANRNYDNCETPIGYSRAGNATSRAAYEVMAESMGEKLVVDKMKLEKEIALLDKKRKDLEYWVDRYKDEKKMLHSECAKLHAERNDMEAVARRVAKSHEVKRMEELKSDIENAMENLNNCETPEGRDVLRKAQCFVDSVNVKTSYDNTAFIAGLAAILSDGKVNPLHELKKINPKIKDIQLDSVEEWELISHGYKTDRNNI